MAQKTADEPYCALGKKAAAVELPSVSGELAVEFGASANPGREAAHGHARGGIGEVGPCQVFSFHGGIRFRGVTLLQRYSDEGRLSSGVGVRVKHRGTEGTEELY